jgi:hypothetical protein
MAGRGLVNRLLGAVDLAIDVATLGEYGLETLPDAAECELTGDGWEALAPARRGGCAPLGAKAEPAGAVAAR